MYLLRKTGCRPRFPFLPRPEADVEAISPPSPPNASFNFYDRTTYTDLRVIGLVSPVRGLRPAGTDSFLCRACTSRASLVLMPMPVLVLRLIARAAPGPGRAAARRLATLSLSAPYA